MVNQAKQYKKLFKFATKAQLCESREEAQKLIIKTDKALPKLSTLSLSENSGESD